MFEGENMKNGYFSKPFDKICDGYHNVEFVFRTNKLNDKIQYHEQLQVLATFDTKQFDSYR